MPDQKADRIIEIVYDEVFTLVHANCIQIKVVTSKATYLLICVKRSKSRNPIPHLTILWEMVQSNT